MSNMNRNAVAFTKEHGAWMDHLRAERRELKHFFVTDAREF